MAINGEIIHVDIIVKGYVQGVSFRAYTTRKAKSLGITGYVRNLSDGNVEIAAEGNQTQLYKLIIWLRNEGSPGSRVDDLKINWSKTLQKFNTFRIAY